MDGTLAGALREANSRGDRTGSEPRIIDAATEAGRRELVAILASPRVVVVDEIRGALEELVRTRRPREELAGSEIDSAIGELVGGGPIEHFGRWVFYRWSDRLVHLLPPEMHRELRLDRNRHKITSAEQTRLGGLRIGIVGLSVGRSIAITLVREGLGRELRLADFDALSLSNLNRLEGSVVDVGINKAVLAARQIAELDPYVDVRIEPAGITDANAESFLEGLDVLVEECDDLAMKLELRERARARRLPVLMATSDRGLLDVERFDLEPEREPFHGLLRGVRGADLRGLSTKDKVPYVLRIADPRTLGTRAAASLLEVKETLATWPQLASDVVHGGAMVTNALRRMTLGELHTSGRFYADLDMIVRDGAEIVPPEPTPIDIAPALAASAPIDVPWPEPGAGTAPSDAEIRFLVACAARAPSGGNMQPWRFALERGASEGDVRLACFLDRSRAGSLLDFAERGSYLALGAALANVLVAREALGFDGPVAADVAPDAAAWTVSLQRAASSAPDRAIDPALRARVEDVFRRAANRRSDLSAPIDPADLAALESAASPLALAVVAEPKALATIGEALGELDRLRLLSRRFREELFSELRFTPEEARRKGDGIEVASLELPRADLAALELLRTGAPMDFLHEHDLGRALVNGARTTLPRSGAVLMLAARASDPRSIVACGVGLGRLWLEATRRDLAVHPWGTPFLFQRLSAAPESLEPWERSIVTRARERFAQVPAIGALDGLTPLLLLRISRVGRAASRSLRREVEDVFRLR